MVHNILLATYYILFFLTPLVWAPVTSELFEFNKMYLVYLLTIAAASCWLIKMVQAQKLIWKTTPLDTPILLFLAANILSTIFSIDPHTSVFGYYSRLNGGLLSTLAYLTLYYCLTSNFTKEDVVRFLKAGVWGAVAVALWAIPEHFGVSPSCLILSGSLDANCWVQDVQSRVFATLGQPNWLASYLAMMIFPVVYFVLTATSRLTTGYWLLATGLLYLAFTFTYSRGATLGLIAGLVVFLSFWILWSLRATKGSELKYVTCYLLLVTFIVINLIFGSALTDFKLLDRFAPPPREPLTTAIQPQTGTQLENGGTESGSIRLIVWRGALEIAKHYPLFGSGVETFAYAYYQFRPVEHNLVSEWDYLYNKAHNEYLNYLATTGLLGFLSYLFLITSFILFFIKYYVSSIAQKTLNTNYLILNTSLLASYVSYLVTNFFGFSVVVTALLFYLFPAAAFVYSGQNQDLKLHLSQPQWLVKLPRQIKLSLILIISGLLTITLIRFWLADTLYAFGEKQLDQGNTGRAYNALSKSLELNPIEPLYRSELSFVAAEAAVAFLETADATRSAQMLTIAAQQTSKLLLDHPKNTSLFRGAIRSYYLLSTLDQSYTQKTLETIDAAAKLAPTDPKLPYNKALILQSLGKIEEAKLELNKALQLKPNYQEALDQMRELEPAIKERRP